ncbi:hypothetical protein DCCM_3199 [Desulfocucumis palustris]|uniref:Uncharacterized protein n=1 Tax=Desulfocucumis palustris TaxID=1898651 RepID=A0A2L2XCL8_9FIRM|nr:hypothetical protein DCCM_3199 [Desulfocucumis palustris]
MWINCINKGNRDVPATSHFRRKTPVVKNQERMVEIVS